ncbi:hypothetical protein BJD99_04245 [Rhodococcus sp. 1163]|nr:hypothetical protein BJD99_04245 [Rhodococcus sp. 1163]
MPWHCAVMTEPLSQPTTSQDVTLMMDHGQFYLRGGLGDEENEFPLLEYALAAQPNSGDGLTMVVLNPHQNNFEMPIAVEVFDARPPIDDDEWQQICEDRLEVGPEGVLQIDSTTMSPVDCTVPQGKYLVQVAGRGFVNYGWPGDTTPGDNWRIRLWPDDGSDTRPTIQWNMPGYGVPENAELISEPVPYGNEEPSWITVFHEDGSTEMVERGDLEQRRLARPEPIEQVAGFNGGQTLAEFDRDLVVGLLATDAATARRIAVYCANAACEHAGLAELPWVRPALDALAENRTPPAPFANIMQINDAFAPLFADLAGGGATTSSSATVVSGRPKTPFDGRGEPRFMTIPALFSAQDPYPHRAAIETIVHASHAYGLQTPDLYAALREAFPELKG